VKRWKGEAVERMWKNCIVVADRHRDSNAAPF
jgi:hypothetical protein